MGGGMISREQMLLPILAVALTAIVVLLFIPATKENEAELVQINGQYESCMSCHSTMTGFSDAHNPQALGCLSCHLGNGFAADKDEAHEGVIRIPGNLTDSRRTCGTSGCHEELSSNLLSTLMTTGSGMVSVNRFVFGETAHPDIPSDLKSLGETPADTHLRQLCASCHLGHEKEQSGPIDELSRGGGCLACHLQYSQAATAALEHAAKKDTIPDVHPALTVKIGDDHCFGCHSRSGRISTNYQGWHETLLDTIPDTAAVSQYRQLQDERVFIRQPDDVHHAAGMECIDCHTWRETMGDGNFYLHQEDQVEISCVDCHSSNSWTFVSTDSMAAIDRKIIRLRGWEKQVQQLPQLRKNGNPLLNGRMDSVSGKFLLAKNTDEKHRLKEPASICTADISGHDRLSCQSCHTAWAPACLGCHTSYDATETAWDHQQAREVPGAWVEYTSDFYADPPTLGVRIQGGRETIDTFIPGMIFTLESPVSDEVTFRRLYAPTAAHTTMKKGHGCETCHRNPQVLGFGRGELILTQSSGKNAGWEFQPRYPDSDFDGLPQDAWTGFLQERDGMVSTRTGARPFTISEQVTILRVAVCLDCHSYSDKKNHKIFSDFDKSRSEMGNNCRDMAK